MIRHMNLPLKSHGAIGHLKSQKNFFVSRSDQMGWNLKLKPGIKAATLAHACVLKIIPTSPLDTRNGTMGT